MSYIIRRFLTKIFLESDYVEVFGTWINHKLHEFISVNSIPSFSFWSYSKMSLKFLLSTRCFGMIFRSKIYCYFQLQTGFLAQMFSKHNFASLKHDWPIEAKCFTYRFPFFSVPPERASSVNSTSAQIFPCILALFGNFSGSPSSNFFWPRKLQRHTGNLFRKLLTDTSKKTFLNYPSRKKIFLKACSWVASILQ